MSQGKHANLAALTVIQTRERAERAKQAIDRGESGETLTDIARDIGVTPAMVSRIVTGKAYAAVGGPRTFFGRTRGGRRKKVESAPAPETSS